MFHFVYIDIFLAPHWLRTFQSRKISIRWILNGLFIVFFFSFFFLFHPFAVVFIWLPRVQATLGVHMRIMFLFWPSSKGTKFPNCIGKRVSDRHIVRWCRIIQPMPDHLWSESRLGFWSFGRTFSSTTCLMTDCLPYHRSTIQRNISIL